MTTPEIRKVYNPEAAQMNDMAKQLVEQNRDDEAIFCLFRALTLAPDFAMARLHLGEILLRRGEYLPGWTEFEWGSRLGISGDVKIHAPQWNGMRLPNSTIILLGSQGYGDVIQFARYIPLVAECCHSVGVGCSPELQPLIKNIEGTASVFTRWQDAPPFTVYAPLTSLPHIFGTTVDNIPGSQGYVKSDPVKKAAWQQKFKNKNKRVGLVWSGRPTHSNDKRRSMSLDLLAPLLELENISFVALQKTVSPADLAILKSRDIAFVGDELHDFSDTAALIDALDLVITVDTSVAHLAGALGKPVWIFVPKLPDWRWLTGREDSPWYASARLFRQDISDDWASAVVHAAKALASF